MVMCQTCLDEKNLKMFGMKSHDCHVFMQRFLPIALRDFLPANVWKAITELSIFFKELTATTITVEDMTRLDTNIPVTLCNLERIFLPSFFDFMEHLPVHLAYEARIGGSVQYRWMYPFERYLRKLKEKMKNKAWDESSILNAYLTEEAATFCSYYFEDHVLTRQRDVPRNYDGRGEVSHTIEGNLSIHMYPGRGLGMSKMRLILDEEKKVAHTYVLLNCEELIASDHGMTDGGNHGGSSYEETDSLALFVSAQKFSNAGDSKEVNQVDIAPTLALLFGVPIPKNNVGTVMAELFATLKAEQQLRALQLNSWQLLRLLQTHFTESRCERFSCKSGSDKSDGAEKFCCSYLHATELHESWILNNSRFVDGDDFSSILLAYKDFLGTASKWLSSRSSDKPIGLLALGIAAMLLSCLGLMGLLFLFARDINFKGSHHVSHTNQRTHMWDLDESLIVTIIFILILCMGSSSMVEEEQYIWHFMTSSFYLVLLRKTIQSITTVEHKVRITPSIYTVISVLICGRILRGWHQGGVNWSHLPDISKLLEQAGTVYIQSLHLLSVGLVIIICSVVLLTSRLSKKLSVFLMLIYLFPSLMIFEQILKYQVDTFTFSVGNTTKIQIIYTLIGTCTVGILVAVPWLMPLRHSKTSKDAINLSNDALEESQSELLLRGFRDSVYVIGWCYIFSWCLLQMLLQQPINSMPTSLLLLQILASICYFSSGGIHIKQWVKVAALYYVGMAGHFGLGNTNTLATIDVAGAFNGISSHSTVLSGILMFIITYASPMLALLSMLMDVSMMDIRAAANSKDSDFGHVLKMTLGYPCLVPLALNSVLLVAYTIVLLLMRNHLFVWSVFSPKYLYVCATTVCVYIGVSVMAFTVTYTCMVLATRRRLLSCSM